MAKNKIYAPVGVLSCLKELSPTLYGSTETIRKAATAKLSRVVETFPHYTAHDASHKQAVLTIIEWLAGETLLRQLNAPELLVLYSSVYLHDVGMATTPEEREAVHALQAYKDFASSSGLSDIESLAEWVRRVHHQRSSAIIRDTHADPTGLGINDKALAEAIALVCQSHGLNDLQNFEKYDPFYAWGISGETLCLPILGVLLRLGDLLHVTSDRTPLAITPLIKLDNARSRSEWAKHLSTVGIAPIPERAVRMSCICVDPDVHRDLLRLCDYVNREFDYCNQILELLVSVGRKKYQLTCDCIKPNIQARGYEPWLDLSFQLDKQGIFRLLTGERIYQYPGAIVRELLMNAVDATRQRAKLSGHMEPILVTLDTTNGLLCVTDQGIGMDENTLRTFLLQLGRSIYHSEEYRNRYNFDQRIESLSEFGIGFASCFLIADHVIVETRYDGQSSILLDMYDLLGFAAARPGSLDAVGTKITLVLKREVIDNIKTTIRALHEICVHVEVPITSEVDGAFGIVTDQNFCQHDEDRLIPFFRTRENNFVVEHRHFASDEDDIEGCINMVFDRRDDVMFPGWKDHYQLKNHGICRVSQLGFSAPPPDKWPDGLLPKLNVSAISYDLNLSGKMRLELDPSRTTVLPSPHNKNVVRQLDEHFVNFILDLHQRYWANLPRASQFDVYEALGRTLFTRLMQIPLFPWYETIYPLVNLLFQYMPFDVVSKTTNMQRMTWDEIRDTGKQVLFYQRHAFQNGHPQKLAHIVQTLPEVLVIIENPSYSYSNELFWVSSLEAIFISDVCRRVFQVVQPWKGSLLDLRNQRHDYFTGQNWLFLKPFIPANSYAIVSPSAQRRSAAGGSWINSSHPKIHRMIVAAQAAEAQGKKTKTTVEFLNSLHHNHFAAGNNPEYVDYVNQSQQGALNELISAGQMKLAEANSIVFTQEDFVPWEGDAW